MVEFGDRPGFTYVMGGLARDYSDARPQARRAPDLSLLLTLARRAADSRHADRPAALVRGPDRSHLSRPAWR